MEGRLAAAAERVIGFIVRPSIFNFRFSVLLGYEFTQLFESAEMFQFFLGQAERGFARSMMVS
jgi:hypothetical protein